MGIAGDCNGESVGITITMDSSYGESLGIAENRQQLCNGEWTAVLQLGGGRDSAARLRACGGNGGGDDDNYNVAGMAAVAVVMMKCFCVVPHCSALHYYYCSLCITVVLCVSRGYYIYSCGLYCCCYFPFVFRFGLFCHHSSIILS